MTVLIELPDTLQQSLREWAHAADQSEEEVIRSALEAYLAVPWSLHDELEAWQTAGVEAIEAVAPMANEAW